MLKVKSYVLKFFIEFFLCSFFMMIPYLSNSQDDAESFYLDSLSFAQFQNNEYSMAEANAKKLFNLNLLEANIYRINANTLLGIINKNRGFFISATEHYLDALNDATFISDTARQSAILNNLGALYKVQHNHTNAIYYFEKSLALEKILNNPEQESIRFYNLAETYVAKDSLEMALSFFNNSLLIEQKIENKIGIVYAYIGITDVYLNMNNAFQSELMIEKLNGMFPINNVKLEISFEFLQSKYAFLLKKYDLAEQKITLAIDQAKTNNLEFLLPELLLFRVKILKENKSLLKLSEAYQEYISVTETMNSQLIRIEINDLNYQNELKRKQIEVETLRIDREIANASQFKENRIIQFLERILIFILGLLVLSLVLVILGVKKMKHLES